MFKVQNLIIALMLIGCQISFAQPIVQPCYLLPQDQFNVRKIYTTDSDELRERLSEVRAFFASEMQRLGYGEKTFEFSTDIPIYQGRRNLADYKTIDDVRADLQANGIRAKSPNDILLVFLVGAKSIQGGAAGIFAHLCQVGTNICKEPLIVKPLEGRPEYFNAIVAHELGHAFGFNHHQEDEYLLMSKVIPPLFVGRDVLDDVSINPETAAVINTSPALSLIGDPPTNNKKSAQAENIDVDVNKDGYVDLYDVPHLVAYYPFDGNADDASGNGNHWRGTGSINYVDGKFGKALELDSGEYIEMEATDTLHGDIFQAAPFTLSAWIYPNPETGYGHVWRSRSPTNAGHTLFIIGDEGGISWRARINGRWTWDDLCETKPGIVKANEWIHVAVTNDGEKFRIYANGEVVAQTNFKETDGGNTIYSIGNRVAGETFAGWIDDYAIFSGALSEGEINRIIQVGVKQFIESPNDNSDIDVDLDVDVNDDGSVDLSDVLIVRKGMSSKISYDTDINNDGITDEVDLAIVKAAAHAAIAAAAPARYRNKKITTWGALKKGSR